MILIEFLCGVAKWLFYHITRPIIWIITARDCRHCKHGRWKTTSRYYNDPFGWYCGRNYHPDTCACLSTPWRCKFEKREKKS